MLKKLKILLLVSLLVSVPLHLYSLDSNQEKMYQISETELQTLSENLNQLKLSTQRSETELKTLRSQLSQAESSNLELKTQLDTAKNYNQELQIELSSQTEALEDLKTKLNSSDLQLQNASQLLTKLEQEHKRNLTTKLVKGFAYGIVSGVVLTVVFDNFFEVKYGFY